jgi:hypothetical protein
MYFEQLSLGFLVSLINFGLHAVMTGLIVVVTRHIAGRTDDLHIFLRVTALMVATLVVLTITHMVEIAIWAGFTSVAGILAPPLDPFEYAFENYTALGYGDILAGGKWRIMGPIMSLNGLLLIGWSVAIIFEVLKMAEVQIGRTPARKR